MTQRFIVLLLVLCMTGCAALGGSSDDDNFDAPAALESFKSSVDVTTLWSRRTGAGAGDRYVRLLPAVAHGTVYTADRNGRVSGYDANTGKQLWTTETKAPISGGVGVGDGLVLVGTSDAEVLALDAYSGTLVWRAELTGEVLSVPRAAIPERSMRTRATKCPSSRDIQCRYPWVSPTTT